MENDLNTLCIDSDRWDNIGVWEWEVGEDRIHWSKNLYLIFGVEKNEFDHTLEGYLGLIHPEDREEVAQRLESAMEILQPYTVRHRILRKDGTVRTILGKGEMHLDEAGAPVRMLGTAIDVSDRGEPEKALPLATFSGTVTDGGGLRFHYLSDAFFHWMESPPEPENFFRLLDPQSRKSLETVGQELELRKNAARFLRFRSGGGSRKNFRLVFHRPKKRSYFTGYMIDVTEEMKARERAALFRRLLDDSNDMIFVCDPDGTILDCNRRAESLLGYGPGELLGEPIGRVETTLDTPERWEEHVRRLREHRKLVDEGEHRRKDGTRFPVEASPSLIKTGEKEYIVAIARDLTEREKERENSLMHSVLLKTVVGNAPVILWMLNMDGVFTMASGAGMGPLGLTAEGLIGRSFFQVFQEEETMTSATRKALEGTPVTMEVAYGGRHFQGYSTPRRQGDRQVGVIGLAVDITGRVLAERELEAYKNQLERQVEERTRSLDAMARRMERYVAIVDNNVLTTSTDTEGNITYVSEAFCRASGYTKAELIGANHRIIRHPDMPKNLFQEMWKAIASGERWEGELMNRRKDGGAFWVWTAIEPNRDETGKIIGYTAIRHDISEKKRIEELTISDPLTGLYNRRHFNTIVPREIRRARRDGKTLAFAMLDVDLFKQYNDRYGHLKGDDALAAVAAVMKEAMRRAGDFAFRLGGEEFGLLFTEEKEGDARRFTEGIRKKIKKLNIPHKSNPAAACLTVSMGVTLVTPDRKGEMELFYKEADQALYRAKEKGRDKVVFAEE